MGFSNTQCFETPPGVISRSLGNETVLLHLGVDEYFGLDPVGTRVWDMATQGASFGGIVEQLLEEDDVERDVLITDVTSLLSDMVTVGLIALAD
jgi:hypothetical protein